MNHTHQQHFASRKGSTLIELPVIIVMSEGFCNSRRTKAGGHCSAESRLIFFRFKKWRFAR